MVIGTVTIRVDGAALLAGCDAVAAWLGQNKLVRACAKCGRVKPAGSRFYRRSRRCCRACENRASGAYHKQRYALDPGLYRERNRAQRQAAPERFAAYDRKKNVKRAVCIKLYRKRVWAECDRSLARHKLAQWRKANPEKERALQKRSLAKCKVRRLAYLRQRCAERRKSDPRFKLSNNLRNRLYYAVRRKHDGRRGGSAVRDLGCSLAYLRVYLESKFLPGMSWDNWGPGYGDNGKLEWHIDHVTPLKAFDLTDRVQCAQACHYSNLQPLWARDNLLKGSKAWPQPRLGLSELH